MKRIGLLALSCGVAFAAVEKTGPYDPMKLSPEAKVEFRDLSVVDAKRKRTIPLRVYVSGEKGAKPVVLFSHGLGGSCKNNAYVANHWAARGFVVVAMQHAGSDEAVWKDAAPLDRMKAMNGAANLQNLLSRVADVPAVIDQLTKWNAESGHWLAGRMDLEHIGMSGHSFGAVTTQAVSGQTYLRSGPKFTDKRIDAALAFSPSAPELGDPARAFGSVKIPWMLMTGTRDQSPIGNATPESRRKVYPALPPGGKYELVLDGANHMTFSDARNADGRDPRYHKAIIALSTAFWETYLCANADAKKWLEGDGAKGALAPADVWHWK